MADDLSPTAESEVQASVEQQSAGQAATDATQTIDAAEAAATPVVEPTPVVSSPAPPVDPAKAAAVDHLKLHIQELKLFVKDFDHDVGDDLNEIVQFLKARL